LGLTDEEYGGDEEAEEMSMATSLAYETNDTKVDSENNHVLRPMLQA